MQFYCVYAIFVCAYIVCIHATFGRGAFLSFAYLGTVLLPFCPLQPFRSLLPRTFFRFPFSRFSRIVSRVHAVTFAVRLCSNTFNVHFIRFLAVFKRVICVAYTFAPFALFRALI